MRKYRTKQKKKFVVSRGYIFLNRYNFYLLQLVRARRIHLTNCDIFICKFCGNFDVTMGKVCIKMNVPAKYVVVFESVNYTNQE